METSLRYLNKMGSSIRDCLLVEDYLDEINANVHFDNITFAYAIINSENLPYYIVIEFLGEGLIIIKAVKDDKVIDKYEYRLYYKYLLYDKEYYNKELKNMINKFKKNIKKDILMDKITTALGYIIYLFSMI